MAGVTQLLGVLQVDGLRWREAAILVLFAILFAWISASFWLACFGAVARLIRKNLLPLRPPGPVSAARTAILMPVYNEDVTRVFAGVRAIYEEAGPDFDFYVLSDSTNPANWVAEELAWERLKSELGSDARLFYRHRPVNTGRKTGNIKDFCENWGQLYDYMVILDADSLMTGRTLTQLVGLMDANPRAALIQAPAQLTGRHSLFARIQQFASSVYGPVFNAGLALLQGPDGNYWGHNAIIRVHVFMQHCGLPHLPGKPPFGGEIMSHDFVEAALLRRAGWEVWMAPDIGGSYEEPPPSISDHLIRDRRWCQGNLQHLRIIFARGLAMPSRLHLALGIMTYISSPLWLLLLLASAVEMMTAQVVPGASFIGLQPSLPLSISHHVELLMLVLATIVLLFGPKLMALAVLLDDADATRAHGGLGAVIGGFLWESLFSTLLAPIVMLQHSWYVVTILMGMSTGWGSQQRADRALPLKYAIRYFWPHTLVGLAATIILWHTPSFHWFLPLLAGLLLSIPLVIMSSSPLMGQVALADRLFLVPSETRGLPVQDRAHALVAASEAEAAEDRAADVRHLVLEDARVRALHLALLAGTPAPPGDPVRLEELRMRAFRRETAGFSREDWTLLLSDPESLKALS